MGEPAPRTLVETIERQRLGCELAGSPLYATVLATTAEHVTRPGPVQRLLAPVADAPFGDAMLLRFLAAVHQEVLAGRAPDLAAHYPSAGGSPGPDLPAAFVAAVGDHEDALRAGMGRAVQTNEVGRSAVLVGGYLRAATAGLPLRLREVGASAGLNLNVDRYRYRQGADTVGPADSPLRFDEPWVAGHPDLATPLLIADRRGCDRSPLDATDPVDRLRLRSYVWPDQPDRRARLDAALEVALAHPPLVERAGAVDWLRGELAEPVDGRCTVVSHSIVLQYLSTDDRADLLAVVDGAARRATPDAPLAWVRMEPGGDQAELRITTWPGGRAKVLATSGYHGPPVTWRASR